LDAMMVLDLGEDAVSRIQVWRRWMKVGKHRIQRGPGRQVEVSEAGKAGDRSGRRQGWGWR
jgi:hypothetical protein